MFAVTAGDWEDVITPITIIDCSLTSSSSVMEYPTEDNFYTYNKVKAPMELNVTMIVDEANFHNIETCREEAKLLDVSVKDVWLPSCTLESYDYSVTHDDGTLIVVSAKFKEVRVIKPEYTSIQKPKYASHSNTTVRGQQTAQQADAKAKTQAFATFGRLI